MAYSFLQILFFFYFYCVCGWIIESTYVSVLTKKVTNRGFLHGPMIPIYGCGAMTLILSCGPFMKWPVAVFFVGLIAASVLEYITGALMEAIFKVRYWDYTGKFMNINGHVCLFTSVCWGFLACIEDYFLHKPIEKLSNILTEKELNLFVMVVSVYFIVDLTLSFKAAFDMRDIIIKMEKAKDEMRLMQKRLDVMLAFVDDSKDDFLEDSKDKIEDIAKSVEEKLEQLRKSMEEKPAEYAENVREEFKELRDKYTVAKASRFGLPNFKDIYKRGLILGNPDMVSRKFRDSLETIKSYVTDKKDKND